MDMRTVVIDDSAAGIGGTKATVEVGGMTSFSYSLDGRKFTPIGERFQAKKGVRIGAKVGIFSLSPNVVESGGYADFDWFHIK